MPLPPPEQAIRYFGRFVLFLKAYFQDGTRFSVIITIIDFFPLLLTAGYGHFDRWGGVVLYNCALLLYEEFEQSDILAFYQHYRELDKSRAAQRQFSRIDNSLKDARDDAQKCCTILMGLVRLYGYSTVRRLFLSYLEFKKRGVK